MRQRVNAGQIKRALGDWLKVLVLLLDEALVVALVILALRFFRIQMPLALTIVIAVLAGVFVLVVHIAVIPSFHRKKVTGREGMIGLLGRVVEPLTPSGTVFVKGEHWKAKSLCGDMQVDEDVEIVGIDGLTLTVKRQAH